MNVYIRIERRRKKILYPLKFEKKKTNATITHKK